MDRRDRAFKWWQQFDERGMRALPNWVHPDDGNEECEEGFVDSGEWIPVEYERCGTCEGKGKHVNPDIDRQGLTASDFDEDPDMFENYTSGMYDVPCRECDGKRVAIVVDERRATPEQLKSVQDWFQEQYEDRMTRYWENGGQW